LKSLLQQEALRADTIWKFVTQWLAFGHYTASK
jgi:hypothetical protein